MNHQPRHALTIDVEDWNNGAVLLLSGRVVPPTAAVVGETRQMFRLTQEHGITATWFFLGEIAEHFPSLVREIADAGHEIAVHGYHHELVYNLSPALFRERARLAKDRIEQAAGVGVQGYRAAAATITKKSWWALEILAELGYRYDSSVFPFAGRRYGVPDAPLEPHWIQGASGPLLYEIPLTVIDVLGKRLPACGGGYLRHFPLAYSQLAVNHLERRGRSAVFYLHPYELSRAARPGLVPSWFGWKDRVRLRKLWIMQARNRAKTETKLRKLFGRHSFGSLATVFKLDQVLGGAVA